MSLRVSDVRFSPAAPGLRESGLLGYAAVTFDEWLLVEGVTVRRTREGRVALSFPLRADGRGRRRATVRPRHDEARRGIETQVIEALRRGGYLA